jgi:hypothetical protein
MASLRSRGVRVIIYLDDTISLNEKIRKGLMADVKIASDLLKKWDFSLTGKIAP